MGQARYYEVPDQVEGAWASRRRLAAALRELSARCVSTDADGLDAAAEVVEALVTRLPPGTSARDAFLDGSYFADPIRWIDRGAMMGRCNPVAPPMVVCWDGARSTCDVVLGEAYVGPPGMVHGGILAACFDQICGHAAVAAGFTTLTARLSVTYRRPVPLEESIRFEGWIVESQDRKVSVRASCTRGGETLAECDALFVHMEASVARAKIAER